MIIITIVNVKVKVIVKVNAIVKAIVRVIAYAYLIVAWMAGICRLFLGLNRYIWGMGAGGVGRTKM